MGLYRSLAVNPWNRTQWTQEKPRPGTADGRDRDVVGG
jgi:hypothetical protein